MYSVYFSSESPDRASSRRSSCLRSSNRSVRKSLPSQVNKSNAKKHGGFPRRNIRFLNCGLPRISREQISPSMTALTFGMESEIDSVSVGSVRFQPLPLGTAREVFPHAARPLGFVERVMHPV